MNNRSPDQPESRSGDVRSRADLLAEIEALGGRAAAAETQLRDVLESFPDGIAVYDADDRLVLWNDNLAADLLSGVADLIAPGVTYEALVRAAVERDLVPIPDGDADAYVRERVAHHRKGEGSIEIQTRGNRWMLSRERRTPGGGIIGTRSDITDRKRAEAALMESEERFRAVVDNCPNLVLFKDLEGRFRIVNRRACEWHGMTAEELLRTPSSELFPPDQVEINAEMDRAVLRDNKAVEWEYDLTYPDGTVRKLLTTKFPVLGRDGRILGVGIISTDVSAQRQVEEQLRQAQKMEAVGQLTGGIAHDFNNLLTVVLGNLEILEAELAGRPELLALVERATGASLRGAALTQRLLAFSRKQALSPRTLELNDLIAGMNALLQQALGETVVVVMESAGDLWACEADPAQVENALLNLAINARDAMPGGGRLTVAVRNARVDDGAASGAAELAPGDYVAVSVADDGQGMTPEIAGRAFEPFFTTKPVNEGSGLGLSMVYGFAKQSGGGATIVSAPGDGTTVTIYLPRAKNPTAADAGADAGADAAPDAGADAGADGPEVQAEPRRGGEAVLVVEDDPAVRGLVADMLDTLGYRVLTADSGEAALAQLEEFGSIDLLLIDVVLTGALNGRDLAREARRRGGKFKILYMTGYGTDVLARDGRLDPDTEVLPKPFAKSELAAKVRQVLDS